MMRAALVPWGLLLVAGCRALAPEDAIREAREAYAEAVEEEAARYSAESLEVAVDAMETASRELEKERARSWLVRDYTRTRELFGQARRVSNLARFEAKVRRDELRRAAEIALAEARTQILELSRHDVPATREEVEALGVMIDEATSSFCDADYVIARDRAAEALELARDVERGRDEVSRP